MKNTRAFLIILALAVSSCATPPAEREHAGTVPAPEVFPPDVVDHAESAVPAPPREHSLTIIAAGDNLYHDVMIRDGEAGVYASAYSEILPLIEQADIAFINQETLLAGEDFGFSGYPRFNSPQELGRALTAAGFDVVNQATNHVMDKGEKAVFATMDFWDTAPEVTLLGIHRSEEKRAEPKLLTKNNITLGFLSYTYGTNGLPVPKDKPYLVSLINTEIMAEEIDALRPLCDVLVVSMHWGEEYRHDYGKTQQDLAAFLAEHEVDLVIGHHPHVIQAVEYVPRPDGKSMLCFYSLGNLISAQARNYTMLGALAYVKIKKTPSTDGQSAENIVFADAGAVPVVTHYEKGYTEFKVYPLYAYTEELLEKHRMNQSKKELTLSYLDGLAAEIFGEKELSQSPFTPPAITPEPGPNR